MRPILLSLVLLTSTAAAAQEAEPPAPGPLERPNAIVADLSLGVLAVGYDRLLTPWLSAHAAIQYYRPWYVSDHVFGFGAEVRPFFYPMQDGFEGLYLSPGIRLSYVRAEVDTQTDEGVAWSVRLTVGWGFVFGDLVTLRLGGGIQYHRADLVDVDAEPNFDGPYPVLDAYVGVTL